MTDNQVTSTKLSDPWQSPIFRPLLHEAGIAAETLCIGLTTLRKANYQQSDKYYAGFFSYTIGLERAMKLTILLDSLVEEGAFPTDQQLKKSYGHDLSKLITAVKAIRANIDPSELHWKLPHPDIIDDAVSFLAEFAKTTRYYNLDVLSGKAPSLDPVARWFHVVGKPLLAKRPARQTLRNEAQARTVAELLKDKMIIRSITEDGTPVSNVEEAAIAEHNSEYVAKEGTFLCTALARYVIEVLRHRGLAARGAGHAIPSLGDFFALFNNDDALLKNRKSFSIH
ncbi:hypothetical protein [Streptomyces turgidiscabies]|uniref:HEPN AbiU2-like domain-containing protein n=1 Tax=Streptomyces turgidiscabies TaxID=85558 RepID=A0ABU0RVG6_9ACTN|nr:hypothetical protein [Streptomyces turgidiscabies]MDQ0935993.1 hypothetical protein [Streptomyces turgidiscabies]